MLIMVMDMAPVIAMEIHQVASLAQPAESSMMQAPVFVSDAASPFCLSHVPVSNAVILNNPARSSATNVDRHPDGIQKMASVCKQAVV